MKAPRRLSGSRIAVGVASVGLTVGAFSLYSRKRYGRSAAASLAEYGVRPVKTLAARIPMTERIAAIALMAQVRARSPSPWHVPSRSWSSCDPADPVGPARQEDSAPRRRDTT